MNESKFLTLLDKNIWVAPYFLVIIIASFIFRFVLKERSCLPKFFSDQKWTILDAAFMIVVVQIIWILKDFGTLFFRKSFFMATSIHIAFLLITVIVLCGFLQFKQEYSLISMGLTLSRWFERLILGLKWSLSVHLFFLLCLYLILFVLLPDESSLNFINRHNKNNLITTDVEYFFSHWGVLITILVFLLIIMLANVEEEILFRGLFYGALRKKTEPIFANLISSFIFMFSHGGISLSTFLFGMFMAYLYERSHSLIPPLAVHISHNIFAYTFSVISRKENIGLKTAVHVSLLGFSVALLFIWVLPHIAKRKFLRN